MKIKCNGINITLSDKDFITEGGEGKIYGKDKFIYKIYTDKNKVINPNKIKELSVLDMENIVKPIDLVYNATNNSIVGFTMNWIKNTIPLVKLFSNSYKDVNNVSNEQLLTLIEKIKEVINFIHSKQILIVDGNEFNYLVDEKTLSVPYFIDVDSYQTPNFPATAIMSSIVDYSCKGKFSVYSDWFSFGIVAFQLLTGIHPYKGTHPDYSKKDLEGRMRNNISVFNKDVTLPPTAKSLDVIPSEMKEWFLKIFEKSERLMPPFKFGVIPTIIITTTVDHSLKFDIKLIIDYPTEIKSYQNIFNNDVIQLEDCIYINRKKYNLPNKKCKYILSDNFEPLFVYVDDNNFLKIENEKEKIQVPTIYSENNFIIENKLFNIYEDKVTEIDRINFGNRTIFSVKNSWNILLNATKVFDGFLFSNILGKFYLNVPYDFDSKQVKMAVKHIPELEDYRIIDGRRIKNVIIIIGHKNNQYDKIMVKFDEQFDKYLCHTFSNTQDIEINFTILDNNIGIFLNEENLYIMSSSIKNNNFNVIQDINFIKRNPVICSKGMTATFYSGNKFYEFKVKQQK
jgi:hypothetical protein